MAQPSQMGSQSIRLIGMLLTWVFSSMACSSFYCRDGLYQRDEEARIVYLRASNLSY